MNPIHDTILRRWFPDAPDDLERATPAATAAALIAHLEAEGEPRADAIRARLEADLLDEHVAAQSNEGSLEAATSALLIGAEIEGYGLLPGAASRLARALGPVLPEAEIRALGPALSRALPDALAAHPPRVALWLAAAHALPEEAHGSARRRVHGRLLEARVYEACRGSRWHVAITLALRGETLEGLELRGLERPLHVYLSGRCRSASELEEAYALFGLRLTEGLPNFAWRCSLARYCYRLAASAAAALRADPYRKRALPLETPHRDALRALTRTRTRLYLRSSLQQLARQLFEEHLEEEDWTLVFHRIYQRASWKEIAALTLNEDDPSPAELRRTSARLRQRFSRTIKPRLRDIAAGLRALYC